MLTDNQHFTYIAILSTAWRSFPLCITITTRHININFIKRTPTAHVHSPRNSCDRFFTYIEILKYIR